MDFAIRLTKALTVVAVLAALTACAGPPVESTSIDGRVRDISNWTIEWVGDSTVTVDEKAASLRLTEGSKYSLPQYCLEYVGEVKRQLVQQHDYNFFVNLPVEGRLAIKIFGQNRALFTGSRTDAQRIMDEMSGRAPREGLPDPFNDDRSTLLGYEDLVRKVEVQVLALDGTLLGEIFIGDDGDKKVKPEHVAKAIDEALSSGGVVLENPPG